MKSTTYVPEVLNLSFLHQFLRLRLEVKRQGEIHWLERAAAAKEFTARYQQCALPGSALDSIQRPGIKNPCFGGPSIAKGLETPIWLRARAAGDLRGIRAPQGHLL